MATWTKLDRGSVSDWLHQLAQQRSSEQAPIFSVQPLDLSLVHWRPVFRGASGVWELRRVPGRHVSELIEAIITEIEQADEGRKVYREEAIHDPTGLQVWATAFADFDSRTSPPPVAPPVQADILGAGGRIIACPGDPENSFSIDAVIRRRLGPFIPSQWRDRADLDAEIQRRIDTLVDGHELVALHGAFGYLELSKFEIQEWMRPVLILEARISASEQGPVWDDVLVIPASTTGQLHASAGLG